MNLDFDHEDFARSRNGAEAGTGFARPDWHGLRARLYAAQATRGVLNDVQPVARAPRVGSFDSDSARFLALQHQSLATVNPTCWDDGKPVGDNLVPVVGTQETGDRG